MIRPPRPAVRSSSSPPKPASRIDHNLIDLFSDENRSDWYTRLTPNQAVPLLEHDDFVLSESSAILKYLADLF
jgi:glutathione S-transferase